MSVEATAPYVSRNKQPLILLVLFLFTAFWVAHHLNVVGDDLSSSYFGCQIVAHGEGTHLYSHDPVLFDVVGDPLWTATAHQAGYFGLLHPYVQTPLWAYSLRPLCTSLRYSAFNKLFLVLAMLSFAATIWLVARYWAPRLFHPGWIALICAMLFLAYPFRYAILLTQTHIFFVLLTILALILARRQHIVLAGLCLALAAAVKITPGFLLLYWLMTRQRKAALSFVLWSVLLVCITVLGAGLPLTLAYVRELSATSKVLLVSYNNQSFVAWWMGHFYPHSETLAWRIHQIPTLVRDLSLALSLAVTLVGGWIDRAATGRTYLRLGSPYGAAIAMMGATMFAPIAWTHYYILLLVPAMMMLNAYLEERSPILLGTLVAILLLNLDPHLFRGALHLDRIPMIRDQFYSGILAVGGLLYLYARQQRTMELTQPERKDDVVLGRLA